MADTSKSLPPDSPMDAAWTAPAQTTAQASRVGVQHRGYDAGSQIIAGTEGDSHSVRAYPLEDQTDTATVETFMDPGMSFRRTTLLQEKMNGGYTPNTAPVGEGMPAPTHTGSTRNAEDTEAIARMRMGQV